MPKRPSKEIAPDSVTEKALRRIKMARESGAEKLNLFNLKLSTLPKAIGQLSQLQALDLSDNQLSTLPEAIGQLSQLQKLNLSGNRLSTLPEAMQSLERLDALFLHGNPGLGLPDEVLGPTIEEIFGFWSCSKKITKASARNP